MKKPRIIEIKLGTNTAYVYFSDNLIRTRNRSTTYKVKINSDTKIVLEKKQEDN